MLPLPRCGRQLARCAVVAAVCAAAVTVLWLVVRQPRRTGTWHSAGATPPIPTRLTEVPQGVAIARIKLKKVRGPAVVPQTLHYLVTDETPLTFTEVLCLRSAVEQLQPESLYLHGVSRDAWLGAVWPERYRWLWEQVARRVPRVLHVAGAVPGGPLDVLRRFGGIYLAWEQLVLRPLPQDVRRFQLTVSWPLGRAAVGGGVLVAAPGARILTELAAHPRGQDPLALLARLVSSGRVDTANNTFHRVTFKFGTDPATFHDLYLDDVDYLHNYYTLSLHRDRLRAYQRDRGMAPYDELNIKRANNTFGRLARRIWYTT